MVKVFGAAGSLLAGRALSAGKLGLVVQAERKHPDSCPVCIANRKGRTAIKGHRYSGVAGSSRSRLEVTMTLIRRARAGGAVSAGRLDDAKFAKEFPNLHDFLSQTEWPPEAEGGKSAKRETGTLLLFCDGGCVKAMLNDRDAGEVAFCSSDTLQGLLRSIERGLTEGKMDWRENRKPKGRG